MLETYEETQSRGAYQAPTQPAMPITAPHQAVPGYLQTPPTNPRRSNGMRTGAIVVLSLVLLLVLGVGLFAGWQFGRTSTATGEKQAFPAAVARKGFGGFLSEGGAPCRPSKSRSTGYSGSYRNPPRFE